MERELRELIAVLKAEHRVFVQYLQKLTEQQDFLIANNLDGVRKSVEVINMLAQEAISLENGRRGIVDKISRKLEMNPDEVTVSRILERLKGPNFEELERLKNTIMDIHQKVSTQKNRNELLIDQSMSIIRQTVNFIRDVNNPKATYENPIKNSYGVSDKGSLLSRTV